MKPYYEHTGITIYHGDCREVLPTLTEKVDLVLTDPPYGIFKPLEDSGYYYGCKTIYSEDMSAPIWDKRPDVETFERLITTGSKWCIWGGNYFADMLGACKGPLVWDKMTGANLYADGEMAWNNFGETLRIFRHQWCGAFKDTERGQRAAHPTQKPVSLMLWCLKQAKATGLVLDPYMGSGTVLVAAKQYGLPAIGIEIEERYCEVAVKRLAQEVLPL